MIWENGSSVARTKFGLNGEVDAESKADLEKLVGTRPSQMTGAFAASRRSKGGIGLAVDKSTEEKSEMSGNLEENIVEKSGRRDWFATTKTSGAYIYIYRLGRLVFLTRLCECMAIGA